MLRSNFPGRKNARRLRALRRLETAKVKDGHADRVRSEIETLKKKVIE